MLTTFHNAWSELRASMFADDTQIDACSEDIDTIVENLNYDLENV